MAKYIFEMSMQVFFYLKSIQRITILVADVQPINHFYLGNCYARGMI